MKKTLRSHPFGRVERSLFSTQIKPLSCSRLHMVITIGNRSWNPAPEFHSFGLLSSWLIWYVDSRNQSFWNNLTRNFKRSLQIFNASRWVILSVIPSSIRYAFYLDFYLCDYSVAIEGRFSLTCKKFYFFGLIFELWTFRFLKTFKRQALQVIKTFKILFLLPFNNFLSIF